MNAAVMATLARLVQTDPAQRLRPQAVVAEAEATTSPLHRYFTWDDSVAAEAYRLEQARSLIQRVRILNPQDVRQPPQVVYVSLLEDRSEPGGGYRRVTDVLGSAALREELQRTALRELAAWTERYHMLNGLVEEVSRVAGLPPPAPRTPQRRAAAAART